MMLRNIHSHPTYRTSRNVALKIPTPLPRPNGRRPHPHRPQIEALTAGEPDLTANLANTAAALREAFSFFWVGFYLVKGEELVLGPFQGPVACTRIRRGRGVCGASWTQARTLLVPDVEQFPGHIACSSASKSEIVVPIIRAGNVVAVLDVDSDELSDFDLDDQQALEELAQLVARWF